MKTQDEAAGILNIRNMTCGLWKCRGEWAPVPGEVRVVGVEYGVSPEGMGDPSLPIGRITSSLEKPRRRSSSARGVPLFLAGPYPLSAARAFFLHANPKLRTMRPSSWWLCGGLGLIGNCNGLSCSASLRSISSAFSESECDAIESLFESRCRVEVDERPSHGIARRNYWLKTKDEACPVELEWVLRRVSDVLNETFDASRLEFALMHEFLPGQFFDWHADTKPGDGTARTVNVNVVLSNRADFEGGQLEIGAENATLQRGDLHAYPAALPHKVHDIERGKRRTLVLAFRGTHVDRDDYWADMRRQYESLCAAPRAAPKVHWIAGEFHQAIGETAAARAKFADSYRATPQRDSYAEAYAADAAEKHASGRLDEAVLDLEMCHAIRPDSLEYAADLAVMLWTLGRPDDADRVLVAALSPQHAHAPRELVPLFTVHALVLRDLHRISDAESVLAQASQIDAELTEDSLNQLRAFRT